MREKPNIFDYATSELSQDAFLVWLIQWAKEDYKETDIALERHKFIFKIHAFKENKQKIKIEPP